MLNFGEISVSEKFNFMGLCNMAFNCSHIFLKTPSEVCHISKPLHSMREILPLPDSNILDMYDINHLVHILTDDQLFQHSLNIKTNTKHKEEIQTCKKHCKKSEIKPENVLDLYQQQKDTGLRLATTYMLKLAQSMHRTGNYTLTHEHLVQIHKRLLGSVSPRLAGRNRDVELKSAIR